MKRTAINLFLERAPIDTFDPDSPDLWQVVAVDREAAAVYYLTDQHRSREAALDQLRRSIHGSATRYELAMVDRSHNRRLDALDQRVDTLYEWIGRARGIVRGLAVAINDHAKKIKGGGGAIYVVSDAEVAITDPVPPADANAMAIAAVAKTAVRAESVQQGPDRYEPGRRPDGDLS